jgi:hypothetical protein
MTDPVSGTPNPKAELSSMIQAGLGHSVNEKTLSKLVGMQKRLQDRISELSAMLSAHTISSRKYTEELNRALREASSAGEDIMGSDDFHRVFGPELRADQLFDTDAFLREKQD